MSEGISSALAKARSQRKRLAGAMHHWVGRAVESDDIDRLTPRFALLQAWLAEGEGAGAELDLSAEGREVPWVLDLEKEALRLSRCESSAILLRDIGARTWRPRTLGCASRVCPVCGRARAAKACGRWRPVLQAAVDCGCVLRHWTLTQTVDEVPGGLVTGPELRRGWKGTLATDGVVCRAVGGEGLLENYGRLRATWTSVRESKLNRDRWRALGGWTLGLEWTGCEPDRRVPRWYSHIHLLTCTPPGVDVDEEAVLEDWVRATGGSLRAQHVRVVDPDGIIEVLKYPFKSAHLTQAQRIEVLASMKGLHPHQMGGSWSSLSRAYQQDPCWSEWLAAREDPPTFLRLHTYADGHYTLWCGHPSQGRTLFALRMPGGEWRHWYADAARYAALLEVEHRGGPELEPGSDEPEDWFEG